MICAREASGPRRDAGRGRGPTRGGSVECGGAPCFLFSHLTLAAEEIARERAPLGESDRYMAAAARFRDLGYGPPREGVGPVFVREDGTVAPLSSLLADARAPERGTFPGQPIDAELLAAARELLLGVAWHLPSS
jgi:hypothetical protein